MVLYWSMLQDIHLAMADESETVIYNDVKSLYPGNGLSDAVIDFYTR